MIVVIAVIMIVTEVIAVVANRITNEQKYHKVSYLPENNYQSILRIKS